MHFSLDWSDALLYSIVAFGASVWKRLQEVP